MVITEGTKPKKSKDALKKLGQHEIVLIMCKEYNYKPEEFYSLPVNQAYGVIYGYYQLKEVEKAEYDKLLKKGKKHGR